LFNRINAMLRSRGLNPYLGWLHSPADRYESLVCDLEEPFRCRVDRFVVNLIQREQVKMDSFERKPDGRLTLKSEFLGGVIQAWESEQRHRYATDPGSLEQLLHAQICAIEAWIINSKSPMFYRACPTPSAPGTPNVVWPSIPVVS
jgi:CRISPR-associated protein Cas1